RFQATACRPASAAPRRSAAAARSARFIADRTACRRKRSAASGRRVKAPPDRVSTLRRPSRKLRLDRQPIGCILSPWTRCSGRGPTRRTLRDRLRAENGQTLGDLCERLAMTRQAVTKHLVLLEEANLVATMRRGREKLHYLNPVPIHEIAERWIEKFESGRLQALSDMKKALEQGSGE